MLPAPLLLTLLAAAPADFGFVEPTGPSSARVVLPSPAGSVRRACERELLGLSEPFRRDSRLRLHGTVWLYVGPRRFGTATVTDLQAAPDDAGHCVAVATVVTSSPLPLVTGADVLWASAGPRATSARRPAVKRAVERARAAVEVPAPQTGAHGEHPSVRTSAHDAPLLAATARGAADATYVGLRFEGRSVLVRVPERGEPTVLLDTPQALALRDVLDPGRKGTHEAVLAREGAEPRLELWRLSANGAERRAVGPVRR